MQGAGAKENPFDGTLLGNLDVLVRMVVNPTTSMTKLVESARECMEVHTQRGATAADVCMVFTTGVLPV